MSTFVGLADYGQQGLSGFGSVPSFDQAEILKALEAGYVATTGGAALKVESLEASLKVLSHTSKHVKFFRNISKTPAYSTVEEYNQVTDYGPNRNGFVLEGELPSSTDSSYVRKTELVKFLGTVREVTHPATLVNAAHGPLIEQNNNEGILWMLQRIEENLFKGDASLAAAGGEGVQWNGLDALIDSSSFLDLEGDALQESVIEEASQIIIDNFGFPNEMYMSTKTKSNLTKTLQSRQRFPQPYAVQGRMGQSISHMETEGGDIALEGDVFIKRAATPPTAATHTSAPSAPSIDSATTTDASGNGGDWHKSTDAAAARFAYTVVAVNRYGQSAPAAVTAASADVTEDEAVITVTVDEGGGGNTEYYQIYRTEALASGASAPALGSANAAGRPSYSLVAEVPATVGSGAGDAVFADVNFYMANKSTAYIGQNDESVLTMRQLAPLMKMDLAVLAPAYRWMILFYGAPILFAPKKWLRVINIGDLE